MNKINIIYLNIDDLIPYNKNSRTHSIEQIEQIAESIKEFGFTNPILIDENKEIIAGHGRLEAAKKLKLKEVPVIKLNNLSEIQKKAYVIADNKLALNAGWDEELLKSELEEIKNFNFDLDLIGFNEEELNELLNINLEVEELEDKKPKEQEYNEVFNIIVKLENEQQQEELFNKLTEEGYVCQVQSL